MLPGACAIQSQCKMYHSVNCSANNFKFFVVPEQQYGVEIAVTNMTAKQCISSRSNYSYKRHDAPEDGAFDTVLLQVCLRLLDELRQVGWWYTV